MADPHAADDQGESDLLERLPVIGRSTTHLERSAGPSCLLSLIIVALLVIVLKRYIELPVGEIVCLSVFVWFGVLTLLMRWKATAIDDDDGDWPN